MNKKSSAIVLAVIFFAILALPTSVAAQSGGQQIRVNVTGDTFTQIVIDNGYQREESPVGFYYYYDSRYRWVSENTIFISVNTSHKGWQSCGIDYLKQSSYGPVQVTVLGGGWCTGDAGNAKTDQKFVEGLDAALNFADVNPMTDALSQVNDFTGCVDEIVKGIKGPYRVFKVSISCGGMAVGKVRDILRKYNKDVQTSW